ncbi:MAG: hypothetical protein R8K48_01945 [Gallionella sp.]
MVPALSREAGVPALSLSQVTTFTDWSLSIPLAESIQSVRNV